MTNYPSDYMIKCDCGGTTTKKFASLNDGLCKPCAIQLWAILVARAEGQERMIVDYGHDVFAREELRMLDEEGVRY